MKNIFLGLIFLANFFYLFKFLFFFGINSQKMVFKGKKICYTYIVFKKNGLISKQFLN